MREGPLAALFRKTEDEGLYLVQHHYWQQAMQQAVEAEVAEEAKAAEHAKAGSNGHSAAV